MQTDMFFDSQCRHQQ